MSRALTQPARRAGIAPEHVVLLAGVCAALHVGKLPPAIPALQQALGLTLVQAGFLLSLVQLAGMSAGCAFGALADGLGLRRSMAAGLAILALASALGTLVDGVAPLLALRAVEGLGFLLAVLPGPGLLRHLVPPQRVNQVLGLWGTYMPIGTALALLGGPLWIAALGWRSWWLLMAAASAAMAWTLTRAIPPVPPAAAAAGARAFWTRLRHTLASAGPWLVAATFATYSSQWLAVIGFLPSIYAQSGASGAATGVLTALVAAVNLVGNIASGRWLQRGVRPARLLVLGFVVMALAAAAAFAGPQGGGLPPAGRYAAVLLFSLVGGVIPAALFSLAVRLAPDQQSISTTVGWVQQWSALGQFAGPPLVSWLASRVGGWHWTWAATGALALLGLVLAWRLSRRLARMG
jgi:MFS family permease